MVKTMFPKEIPITKLKRNKGKNWNSIRQDFEGIKNGKKWVWLSKFYGFNTNVIIITLSAPKKEIGKYKAIFQKIVNSILFIDSGVIKYDLRTKIIEETLSNFWGNAKLKNGSFIQPKSNEEKTTVPISRSNAEKVIDVAEISAFAEWCGLKWQDNYYRVTNIARKSGFTDKQVAFIGMLHGTTQGLLLSSLKQQKCSVKIKKETQRLLKENSGKLIFSLF